MFIYVFCSLSFPTWWSKSVLKPSLHCQKYNSGEEILRSFTLIYFIWWFNSEINSSFLFCQLIYFCNSIWLKKIWISLQNPPCVICVNLYNFLSFYIIIIIIMYLYTRSYDFLTYVWYLMNVFLYCFLNFFELLGGSTE